MSIAYPFVASFFGALLLMTSTASAGDSASLTYDRVSLSVTVEQDVEADLLVAVLAAQREGADAAALAGEVNAMVDWALSLAKGEQRIVSQTLAYSTTPVYNKGTLTGWRVRQSIQLQSQDGAALSGLIGRLQERLLVESIGYQVSDARREAAEADLIKAGIDAFKGRAQLIAERMGQPRHRLVEMQVDADGQRPVPVYRSVAGAYAAADAAPMPPRIEAGNQTMGARVSGVIELQVQ